MTIIYTSEGFFREGEVGEDWQFEMVLGKIILTDMELTLMKKSNISLTEVGTPIDNYTDGFKIPLPGIRKAYPIKNRKIFTVIVETRDGYLFTITLAKYRDSGERESAILSEYINSAVLANKDFTQNQTTKVVHTPPTSNIRVCRNCGEKNISTANFCKKCGKEIR
jgi:hypothetical protein